MIQDWLWSSTDYDDQILIMKTNFCVMRSMYIVEWYCWWTCTSWHGWCYMFRVSCVSTGAWFCWSRVTGTNLIFFRKVVVLSCASFCMQAFSSQEIRSFVYAQVNRSNQGWDWLRKCSCTSLCHTLWCAGDVGCHSEYANVMKATSLHLFLCYCCFV